ncbi:MAG TPA: tRNA lysidine(34) synthetase TilS, partial [Ramlibacter sp.]|nr:tRNA lysidine(34) synthetase TilS [Ramlibacter sp.]
AAARTWPGQVRAIHVHHGLQAAADDFERHCVQACAALGLPLDVVRVDARHRRGDSPEDAARQARYTALADAARSQGARCVLLAQHADDQAETLLLALSRGAGLPGLAAMPARFERHGMLFLRPWLALPGAALRKALALQGVAFIEDPSNSDTGLTRNRIRRALLPALENAFPQFRETFARSARHAAQAQELLAALAAQDLAAMGGQPVIAQLQALPRTRQANLLRHWLRTVHGAAASAAQLEELLDQVAACTTRGHGLRIKVGAGFVSREGACIGYHGGAGSAVI